MVKFTPFTAIHKFFGIPVSNKIKKELGKNENNVKIDRSDGKISVKSKVYVRQKATIGYERVTTHCQTDKIKDYSFETILNKKYSHDKNESKILPGTSNREDSFRQQTSSTHSHDTHFLVGDNNQGVSNTNKISQSSNNPQIYAVYRTVSDLREELHRKCAHSTTLSDSEKCYCEHCGAMTVVNDSLKHPLMFETKENLKVTEELRKKYHRRYKRLKTVTEDPAFVKLLEKYNKLEMKVTKLEDSLIVRESRNSAIRLMYDMYTQSSASTIDATRTIPKIIEYRSTSKSHTPRRQDSKYLCLPKNLFKGKSATPKNQSKAQMTESTSPANIPQLDMNQTPKSIIKSRPSTPIAKKTSNTENSDYISHIPKIRTIPSPLVKPINNNQLCPMPRKLTLLPTPPPLRSQSYVNNKNTNELKTNNKKEAKFQSHLTEIRSKYKSESSNDSDNNLIKLNTTADTKMYARSIDSRQPNSLVRNYFENSPESISSYESSINGSSVRSPKEERKKFTKKLGRSTLNQMISFDQQLEQKSPGTSRDSLRDTLPEKKCIKSKIMDLIIADYKNSKIPINIDTHGTAVRKEVSRMLEIYGSEDLNLIAKILEEPKDKSQGNDNISVAESIVRIENYQDINDKTTTESDADSNYFKKKETKRTLLHKFKKNVPQSVKVKSKPEQPILSPKSLDKHTEFWTIQPDTNPELNILKSAIIISNQLDKAVSSIINKESKIPKIQSKLEIQNRTSISSNMENDKSDNSIFSRNVTPVTIKGDLKIANTTTDSNEYEMSSVLLNPPDTAPPRKVTSNIAKQELNKAKQRSNLSKVESNIPKKENNVKLHPNIPLRLVVPHEKSRQSTPTRSISSKNSAVSLLNNTSNQNKKQVVIKPTTPMHKLNYSEIGKKKVMLSGIPVSKKKPLVSMTKNPANSQLMKPWGTKAVDNSKNCTASAGAGQSQPARDSTRNKSSTSDMSSFSFNETMRYLNNHMSLLEETTEEMNRLSNDYEERQ